MTNLLVRAGDGTGLFGTYLEDCQYGMGRFIGTTVGDLDGDAALDIVVSADPALVVYRSAVPTTIAAASGVSS